MRVRLGMDLGQGAVSVPKETGIALTPGPAEGFKTLLASCALSEPGQSFKVI